jgi:hypothetical protein
MMNLVYSCIHAIEVLEGKCLFFCPLNVHHGEIKEKGKLLLP